MKFASCTNLLMIEGAISPLPNVDLSILAGCSIGQDQAESLLSIIIRVHVRYTDCSGDVIVVNFLAQVERILW